jgi:hypothetical protein
MNVAMAQVSGQRVDVLLHLRLTLPIPTQESFNGKMMPQIIQARLGNKVPI